MFFVFGLGIVVGMLVGLTIGILGWDYAIFKIYAKENSNEKE